MKRKWFLTGTAGLTLISAGAWSNTFDRFARGYAADYIGFSIKNPKLGKITYNAGDFFIASGAVILAAEALFTAPEKT